MKNLTLGIDASNIITGGGLTHLQMLLENINPTDYGFARVVVWSNQETLDKLTPREWLMKVNPPILNHSMPFRFFWLIAGKIFFKPDVFIQRICPTAMTG